MPTEFDEVVTSDYGLAVVGPLLIQLWEHLTPLAGAEAAVRLAGKLGRSGLARTGTLVVVPSHSALPNAETRRVLGGLPAALGSDVWVALAQEGSGFRASAVRGVMTGIVLLSRSPYPHEVFSSVPAAGQWLCPRLGGGLQPDGVNDAVWDLRERIAAAAQEGAQRPRT